MNPPTLHQLKSEASRAKIVQAAYELFLEHGYHAATLRQIAQQAGITSGGIYNQFANKEEIWQAVLAEHHPWINILPVLEAAQGETLEELLQDAARCMVQTLGTQQDILKIMFIELVEFQGRDIAKLFPQIMPRLMVFIQRIASTKGNLKDIPLPVLMRAFLGLIFSFYMTELVIGKEFAGMFGESQLATFVDIYLHGILKNESAEERNV
jgi:AcrR family transcriptional regulator